MTTLHWHDSIASTQDEAHRLAACGSAHGTAVAAGMQTAGRGTRGREWLSPAGGLWLSVVCRPASGSAVEVVSVRTGLAVAEFLDGIILPPARVAVKWPNDLLLGTDKLGGILAEARWQGDALGWIVVGIGINLRNALPATVPHPARLLDLGVAAAPAELAGPLARVVANAARDALPLSAAELTAFARRDWLRGRALRAPEPGIAEGIGPTGLLRVRKLDGSIREVFGTVALAAARV